MKKVLLSCLMLLAMVGSLQAKTQKVNLTFKCDGYCHAQWNGETGVFTWGIIPTGDNAWAAGNTDWVFMTANGLSDDMSAYTKFHIEISDFENASAETLTLVFKKNDGSFPPSGPTKSFTLQKGANDIDLTSVEWGDSIIYKIQDVTIYGCARDNADNTASVKVTNAYVEKTVPDDGEPIYEAGTPLTDGFGTYTIDDNGTQSSGKLTLTVHEWRNLAAGNWTAATADGGTDADGDFAKIFVPSAAQINTTPDVWNTQFFIGIPEDKALAAGDKVKLTMKVKADHAVNGIGAQGHTTPGTSVEWRVLDGVNFTETWQEVSKDVTVKDGMYNIAFDLGKTGNNTIYFKDIVLEITKAEIITSWSEILVNGNLSDPDNTKCFYSKEYPSSAILLSTIVKDGTDNVIKVKSAKKANVDWDSQFFIRLPQSLPAGTKYKVSFKCKASIATNVGPQNHEEPGNYLPGASIDNVAFGTDWQSYTSEGIVPDELDGTARDNYFKNFHTIAFNLTKSDALDYYFKDFSVQIPTNKVTEAEYPEAPTSVNFTVGDSKWTTYSIGKNVSFGEGVTAYAAAYDEENENIKLTEVNNIPAYTGVVIKATAAGSYPATFITSANAVAVEDNDLEVSEGATTGDGSTIYVLANGDKHGVGFYLLDSGVIIPAGKAYLEVPATAASTSAREFIGFADDATTIKAVENLKKSGMIFNLAGQQVKKAQKGIYIIDGKKAIVK